MAEADADAFAKSTGWNPFDLTKVWPHKDYPLIEVGVLELNRNPENYFAEVEQAAFSPASVVPGSGFSPDRMLQGRIFAYTAAPLYISEVRRVGREGVRKCSSRGGPFH